MHEACIYTKQDLKLAYTTFRAKVVIYQKQTCLGNERVLMPALPHLYVNANFGDRRELPTQMVTKVGK